ncbi:MAG: alpha-D-ribose 1-methylphosphonate 5-triphosphate diphosphatase [Rhodobacterales bacterium]|nr:alpha-D-ribose 1-methylphosphonate 5-triphosphate diphosphatase [Rhodobacterales bacterium]
MNMRFVGAEVLTSAGLAQSDLEISQGVIGAQDTGKTVDLSGFLVLPGIVDVHGDGFERHLAPRRGAIRDLGRGLIATEAELAANGITTAILAQFYSWEGGMRGPEFAARMFAALDDIWARVVTDMRPQLRFETHLLADYEAVLALVAAHEIAYVVFNDHLPHKRLAAGKRPARLTGQALKSGRSPEAHLAMLMEMHAQGGAVSEALPQLAESLLARGVRIGSHDDNSAADRDLWRARGARISEFPETFEAAEAARSGGDAVVLGAPNVVRGGSHKGNADAADLVAAGLCDALASDYHYPSLAGAAFALADAGAVDFAQAWGLISSGPARVLGLTDRGQIAVGMRADLVIIEQATRRVCATIVAGKISYMSGEVAARFVG